MTGEQSRHSYADAGVSLDAGQRFVELVSPLAQHTYNPHVLSGIGPFASLYKMSGYQEPILVSSANGVGTKVRIATLMDKHDTIGEDLVNHCVNDVFTVGADPLFFLDYYATGKMVPEKGVEVVKGMARACEKVGCALVGGEKAEMPGSLSDEDYTVAGFLVGAVERYNVVDGKAIRHGDALIGIPSSGLHTNGYSLVRRIFGLDDHPERLKQHEPDLGRTFGEALLEPHRSYYKLLKPFMTRVRGLAHITGGGIVDNVPRIIPSGLRAIIRTRTWVAPPLFQMVQRAGNVDPLEMFRVFNMGVGMVAVCRATDARTFMDSVPGAWVMGEVETREEGQPVVMLV